MKTINSKMAFLMALGFCIALVFSACVQPVDLEELLSKNYNWGTDDPGNGGNGGNGGGDDVPDGSPELGLVKGSSITPLEKGDTTTLQLGDSAIIRVTNAVDFDSIEWSHNGNEQGKGHECTVDSSESPFNVEADHILTVIAMGTNGRPYSTFIIIRVANST